MSSPKLGLVTVLYNAPDVLPDFFASLACQDYKNFQLYVVDNSSQPESLALARALAAQYGIVTTFIDNTGNNVGVAAGNNQGIKSALADNCKYIALINNDLLFKDSDVFTKLMARSIAGDDLVSPLILNYPEGKIWYAGGYFDRFRALAPHLSVGEDLDNLTDDQNYYPYAPTCFLIINRLVFDQIGFMDEKYFAYYDDTDFLYRANQLSHSVRLVRDAIIYHKVSISTGGGLSHFGAYYLTRNRIYFAKKCFHFPQREISILVTVFSRLVMPIFRKNIKPIYFDFLKGIRDGLRM